jgi:transposase
VPLRGVRELRDLKRRRRKMIGVATSERNRVDKILQDANIKLSHPLSDIFGVYGQLMLDALLEGKATPEQIAQFAQSSAKRKIPQMIAALEGHRRNDHHRQMIPYSLEHLRFLEEHIMQLDEQIAAKIEALGYTSQGQLLQTVQAIKENSATIVLAEMGPDMGQFADERHLSSWVGVCPGNNRSAGKNKGSKTTKGNRWLRGTLSECAWAAARKKGCSLKEKFWRLATKKQRKPPATMAVAHTLLVLCYQVLKTGKPYQKRGLPTLSEKQKQRLICHHVQRLGKLGIRVRSLALDPEAPKRKGRPVTGSAERKPIKTK